MNNLDATTQTNTVIAFNSSKATVRLKEQVGSLKGAAVNLIKMVEGQENSPEIHSHVTHTAHSSHTEPVKKVVELKTHKPKASVTTKPKTPVVEKKVVGSDVAPSRDDSRFEDA
jgi:hypothetical protein